MKVVVLLSGGLDSAVCLPLFRAHERYAMGFRYGQAHAVELDYAAALAELEGVPFEVHELPPMPKVDDVVFAGRNAVLIAHAVAYAAAIRADQVVVGCNYSDMERFPDCRPWFLRQLSSLYQETYGVAVVAPLIKHSKTQVYRLALDLGVPIHKTWSCYAPAHDAAGPVPCGKCLACTVRQAAAVACTPARAHDDVH